MSLTGGKQYSGELFHFEKKIVPYLLSRSTLAMSCEAVIITLHSTRAFLDPRNPQTAELSGLKNVERDAIPSR